MTKRRDKDGIRSDRKQTVGPDGYCTECQQHHLGRSGKPGCIGHRTRTDDGQPVDPDAPLQPCGNYPRKGLRVCGYHGGASAAARAAGERNHERAKAEKLMTTLGEPVAGAEAADVIAKRIEVRAGHVDWLLARVRQLEPEALTWGITKRKTAVNLDRPDDKQDAGHERRHYAGNDEGDTFEAKPSIWWALYTEQARELERLCIEAVKVGLDERRVQLAEREGERWVRFIDGVLADFGIDATDPATAGIVARHLEAVA